MERELSQLSVSDLEQPRSEFSLLDLVLKLLVKRKEMPFLSKDPKLITNPLVKELIMTVGNNVKIPTPNVNDSYK